MKLHTSLTLAMAKYATAEHLAELAEVEETKGLSLQGKTERQQKFESDYAAWDAVWMTRFSQKQDSGRCTCPAEKVGIWSHDWNDPCPHCGQVFTKFEWSAHHWVAIAHDLGHLWATYKPSEFEDVYPRNIEEIVYLQNGARMWGDWGYNPPVGYEVVLDERECMRAFVHSTRKQNFTIWSDRIYYELTTTRNLPVAKATLREAYSSTWDDHPEKGKAIVMDITSITTATIDGRPDRLMWLAHWSNYVRQVGGVVVCGDEEVTAQSENDWATIAPMLEQKLLERGGRTPRAD